MLRGGDTQQGTSLKDQAEPSIGQGSTFTKFAPPKGNPPPGPHKTTLLSDPRRRLVIIPSTLMRFTEADPGAQFYALAFFFVKTTSIYSMVFCYSTLVEPNVIATLMFGNETSTVCQMSLIKALPNRWDLAPMGECSSRTLADVLAMFALMPDSRISFGNPNDDGYITGISDAIRFALTDVIMSLAGSRVFLERE